MVEHKGHVFAAGLGLALGLLACLLGMAGMLSMYTMSSGWVVCEAFR
jgi:hypothetical protein